MVLAVNFFGYLVHGEYVRIGKIAFRAGGQVEKFTHIAEKKRAYSLLFGKIRQEDDVPSLTRHAFA
jgi:hypothetical protein